MTKPLVIYHADCTDGFGAAFAAWLKLGNEAEYLPMHYTDTSPDIMADMCRGREVYILDFSFKKLVMEHVFKAAKRVVWLDHHKTAFEMWCGKHEKGMVHIANRATEWLPTLIDHTIVLDDNKSGALLAWEFFHGTEAPLLIRHIDDRDRWQFKLKGSKELHAALASYQPWSFEQWKEKFWSPYTGAKGYFEEQLHMLYDEGAAILRAQDVAVAQAVKHARQVKIIIAEYDTTDMCHDRLYNFSGLAVSCPLHQSEIGHELANKSGTFGLVWYMKEDGSIICSLRSNGDYDVSAIAKAFGGGGHKNAAGFQTDMQTLMGWLK